MAPAIRGTLRVDLSAHTDAGGYIGESARVFLYSAVTAAEPDAVTRMIFDLGDAVDWVPWIVADLAHDCAPLFSDGLEITGRDGRAVARLTRDVGEAIAARARPTAPS